MKKFCLTCLFCFVCFLPFAQTGRVGSFVDTYTKMHHFSGTVLVQQMGKTSFHKSFGMANIPFSVPATNNTIYKIASITKLFTSVLILQLCEEEKLDLQKTIGTYLPYYRGEGKNKVTIHQLLNHTSGMVNMDTVKSLESALRSGAPVYQTPLTSDQLLERFCSGKLVTAPGETFGYNNADYVVLGKILEAICGKTYEEIVRDKILRPLKMNSTGLLHQDTILPQLASTYFVREEHKGLTNDLPVYPENWYAAGSLYSTTSDLLKFSNALYGGKLLKSETIALLTTPGLDDYGYGVWVAQWKFDNKKYTAILRPGEIMGARSVLLHFQKENVTIIILSNTNTTDLDVFAYQLAERVFASGK